MWLVGLCADAAMAQSAPQLAFATLDPTAMGVEVAPAATSLESSILALANRTSETHASNHFRTVFDLYEKNFITDNAAYFANGGSSAISNIPTSSPIATNAIGPVKYAPFDVLSAFIAAYNSLRKLLPVSPKSLIQKSVAGMRTAVAGVASTYNPYIDENGSGGGETASGEPYDPLAWTAAIRIDLREQFGGVRHGKNYRPTFALVESGEKCLIVKINDIGPLEPGRVIDLNERSMRYFDPTKQLGLISDVKVTLLPAGDWTPGPIGSEQPIKLAAAQ
jgi:rare lipoprotein A